MDDPIVDDPDDPDDAEFTFGVEQKLTPAEARTAILSQLATWIDEGRDDFSTADLAPVWTSAGMSRSWVQKQLGKLRDDDQSQRHTLLKRPAPV